MINLGNRWEETHWPDNWTATTVDGNRSAQFEDTLLCVQLLHTGFFLLVSDDDVDTLSSITETGVENLTAGKPREDLL
jgi:hypothetical protein